MDVRLNDILQMKKITPAEKIVFLSCESGWTLSSAV